MWFCVGKVRIEALKGKYLILMKITKIIECTRVPVGHHGTLNICAMLQKHNDMCQMFVYSDYKNVCYL